MGRILRLFLIFFLLLSSGGVWAQEKEEKKPLVNPSLVISSYLNVADFRDEWTELLVTLDNLDIRTWKLQDNNQNQTAFQTPVTFLNIPLWNNLRNGTVIMIWHRLLGSSGNQHIPEVDKSDGYIEVSANDPIYFSGGDFTGNTTLNISGTGDLLQLLNSSGTFIHALGHRATTGSSWAPLPLPKLNQKSSLLDGEAVFVCPGSSIDEYGNLAPQDGTTWTSKNGTNTTFGLPNQCAASATANSDYWRSLRQPSWSNPVLTGTANAGNTQVTLDWNVADDANPPDGTQGYMIARNTTNSFGSPLDGHSYLVGETIGGAVVIALISSSQTHIYLDNITVPCPYGVFYSVYAFKYATDNTHGNDYNSALSLIHI